jgi:hypothetical protein
MPWTTIAFGEMQISAGIGAVVALRGRCARVSSDERAGDVIELAGCDPGSM